MVFIDEYYALLILFRFFFIIYSEVHKPKKIYSHMEEVKCEIS